MKRKKLLRKTRNHLDKTIKRLNSLFKKYSKKKRAKVLKALRKTTGVKEALVHDGIWPD
jgi:hypothetical protein